MGKLPGMEIGGEILITPLVSSPDNTRYLGFANDTDRANGQLSWQSLPSGGGDALTSDPLSQFAATTLAQLNSIISDAVLIDGTGVGDVFKVGTPVDNQIGVWTGDGTIEGDANLTWDGQTLVSAGTSSFMTARKQLHITHDNNDPVIKNDDTNGVHLSLKIRSGSVIQLHHDGYTSYYHSSNPNQNLEISNNTATITSRYYLSDFTIAGHTREVDEARRNMIVRGGHQFSGATTNLVGGHLILAGGAGASGSVGAAHGGNVAIDGGTGYGTGSIGNVIVQANGGNVGMGAASPAAKLEVNAATATRPGLIIQTTDDSATNNLLELRKADNTPVIYGDVGGNLTITGDFTVGQNMIVQGNTVTVQSETVHVADNHLYLNAGYTTAAAETGGFAVNYLPTATTDTVAAGGFTAGIASTSNPTVITTGSATFSAGDLIQISGANDPDNNGLYEVVTHTGTTLTVAGVGTTAATDDFTQTQFTADTTVAGSITKVTVSVLRAGTDGLWEQGKGSTSGVTFSNLLDSTTSVGDVVGPASSTNNSLMRFDGVTGKLAKDSPNLTWNESTLGITGNTTGGASGLSFSASGFSGTGYNYAASFSSSGGSSSTGITGGSGGNVTVFGSAAGTTGSNCGVYGRSLASSRPIGVLGYASSASAPTIGVAGFALAEFSQGGYGVYALAGNNGADIPAPTSNSAIVAATNATIDYNLIVGLHQGTEVFRVNDYGALRLGSATGPQLQRVDDSTVSLTEDDGTTLGTLQAGQATLTTATATSKVLILQTTDDSTSNNLLECQNAAGTVKASINASGAAKFTNNVTTGGTIRIEQNDEAATLTCVDNGTHSGLRFVPDVAQTNRYVELTQGDAGALFGYADYTLVNVRPSAEAGIGIIESYQSTGLVISTYHSASVNHLGWVDIRPDRSDQGGYFRFAPKGDFTANGGGTATFTGLITTSVATATKVGLILKTTDDSTSKNLFECQNAAGSVTLSVTAAGVLSATNAILTTPNLGTPSSGTLTNCTGYPINIVDDTTPQLGGDLDQNGFTIHAGTAENTQTPTGTTATIDLGAENHHTLDCGSASGDITLTLTVPPGPCAGRIVVKQGATARDITWSPSSGTVKWLGTEPTWNADTSKFRVISWTYWPTSPEYIFLSATDTD